eukprot:8529425-Ditylum_brightwellii.AAC.1
MDEESDGEDEINVMDTCWKWDRGQDIPEHEDIPGPDAVDPYNGPHGLRPGIAYNFTTRNITWEEMVCFFGILLRISMEPRRMYGYASYFQDDHFLNLGHGYH